MKLPKPPIDVLNKVAPLYKRFNKALLRRGIWLEPDPDIKSTHEHKFIMVFSHTKDGRIGCQKIKVKSKALSKFKYAMEIFSDAAKVVNEHTEK